MQRRNFLLGAAAATLARPAIGGTAKTLMFVPQSPLASLDPVWTSAMTTRNIGFMIYDVLFGRDEWMNPKPQMLAGYVVEDDGKRWVMTLRENQWFHDGEKVLARDCAASLRRWMMRDPGGRDTGGAARCAGGAGRPHHRAAAEQEISRAADSCCRNSRPRR